MHTLSYTKPNIDRLLSLQEVIELTGMSRATVYRRIGDGSFPYPVKNGRMSRWPASEVDRFIEAAKASTTIAGSGGVR